MNKFFYSFVTRTGEFKAIANQANAHRYFQSQFETTPYGELPITEWVFATQRLSRTAELTRQATPPYKNYFASE